MKRANPETPEKKAKNQRDKYTSIGTNLSLGSSCRGRHPVVLTKIFQEMAEKLHQKVRKLNPEARKEFLTTISQYSLKEFIEILEATRQDREGLQEYTNSINFNIIGHPNPSQSDLSHSQIDLFSNEIWGTTPLPTPLLNNYQDKKIGNKLKSSLDKGFRERSDPTLLISTTNNNNGGVQQGAAGLHPIKKEQQKAKQVSEKLISESDKGASNNNSDATVENPAKIVNVIPDLEEHDIAIVEVEDAYQFPEVPREVINQRHSDMIQKLFRHWRNSVCSGNRSAPWDIGVSIVEIYESHFQAEVEWAYFLAYLAELEGMPSTGGSFLLLSLAPERSMDVSINGRNVNTLEFTFNGKKRQVPDPPLGF